MCDYTGDYEPIVNCRLPLIVVTHCDSCGDALPVGYEARVYCGYLEDELNLSFACKTCHWAANESLPGEFHLCWGWSWQDDEDSDEGYEHANIYGPSHVRFEAIKLAIEQGEVPSIFTVMAEVRAWWLKEAQDEDEAAAAEAWYRVEA